MPSSNPTKRPKNPQQSHLAHTPAVIFTNSTSAMLRSVASEDDVLARLRAIFTVPQTITIGFSSGWATEEISTDKSERAARSCTR